MLTVTKTVHEEYIITRDKVALPPYSLVKASLLLNSFGVPFNEIEYGLTELIKNNDDIAHYGVGIGDGKPKFVFTKKYHQ